MILSRSLVLNAKKKPKQTKTTSVQDGRAKIKDCFSFGITENLTTEERLSSSVLLEWLLELQIDVEILLCFLSL